jgi:hypothetical protein
MEDQLAELRKFIVERYDLEDLRTLCFDLSVDYDSLGGEGKAARARELVAFMQRHGRLGELVAALQVSRGPAPARQAGDLAVPSSGQVIIDSGGGAVVMGDIEIEGGDFVGRDKGTGEQDEPS